MPRYERTRESATTFCEIERDGATVTQRAGPHGDAGETTRKSFVTSADAEHACDALVAAWTAEGFVLRGKTDSELEASLQSFFDGDSDACPPLEPARRAASEWEGQGSRHHRIEEDIFADPASDAAFLEYGEWLSARGDPHGELVRVHAALRARPDDVASRARERALLHEHGPAWLSDELATLTRDGSADLTWRLGFLDGALIGNHQTDLDAAPLYRALLEAPATRFLRTLQLCAASFEGLAEAMAKQGAPATLRELRLDGGDSFAHCDLGELQAVYELLRDLTSLRLRVRAVALGRIDLPRLASLDLQSDVTTENLVSIGIATWPELETLGIHFGQRTGTFGDERAEGEEAEDEADEDRGCRLCQPGDFDALLHPAAASRFPKLRGLALTGVSFADELAARLVRSAVATQLQSLDLSKGALTDAGAKLLFGARARLPTLTCIDLSDSWLSEEVAAELARGWPGVLVDGQRRR